MAEQSPNSSIHALAAIQFAAGVPSFVWQDGSFAAAIQDNGVGDVTVSFVQDRQIDDTEVAYFVTSRGVAPARGAVAGSAAGPNADVDRDKQITIEDGGGAADVNFSLMVVRVLNN